MPKVSVLMSVYNETKDEIRESVGSILKQSFTDFELIIINDCPTNKELKEYLNELGAIDKRIRIYHNEKNIGLALSMNRAAKLSTGDYLARMDADDIAEKERFNEEVNALNSGLYDLVFTNYVCINSNGEIMSNSLASPYWEDEDIKGRLYIGNIIHHPTVMMTREIFEKSGGYRNFPCAQDYDLWLRMAYNGCRFHMINKPLLHYRLREMSVSSRKRLYQKLTHDYIRDLFIERLKTGIDSYSYENYLFYIDKNLKNKKKQQAKVEASRNILQKAAKNKKSGNFVGWLMLRIQVFLTDTTFRASYLKKIKYQYELNRYLKRSNK